MNRGYYSARRTAESAAPGEAGDLAEVPTTRARRRGKAAGRSTRASSPARRPGYRRSMLHRSGQRVGGQGHDHTAEVFRLWRDHRARRWAHRVPMRRNSREGRRRDRGAAGSRPRPGSRRRRDHRRRSPVDGDTRRARRRQERCVGAPPSLPRDVRVRPGMQRRPRMTYPADMAKNKSKRPTDRMGDLVTGIANKAPAVGKAVADRAPKIARTVRDKAPETARKIASRTPARVGKAIRSAGDQVAKRAPQIGKAIKDNAPKMADRVASAAKRTASRTGRGSTAKTSSPARASSTTSSKKTNTPKRSTTKKPTAKRSTAKKSTAKRPSSS